MRKYQPSINLQDSDKITWLANQIFAAYPQEVTGLKLYTLDCEKVLRGGDLDPQIGIYRDAEDGPCDICLAQTKAWRNRVVAQNVVYNSKFQIESI